MMEIVEPNERFRETFLDGWDEFAGERDDPSRAMGASRLPRERVATQEGFAEFCDALRRAWTEPRPGFVPASTLWAVEGGRWLGRVSMRHELNQRLLRFMGHIGYAVRPSARRRGVATALMRAGLDRLVEVGVVRVLVVCDDDNVASRRIIESAGGELENVVDGLRRYWIHAG